MVEAMRLRSRTSLQLILQDAADGAEFLEKVRKEAQKRGDRHSLYRFTLQYS